MSSLEEVMGSPFSDKQKEKFWNQMGIVLKAHVSFLFLIHFLFKMQNTIFHQYLLNRFDLLQVLNVFDYKQFCGMAAMAERLYCADFSRTGQDKYTQQESKVYLRYFV